MISGLSDAVVNYFHYFRLGSAKPLQHCLYGCESEENTFLLREFEVDMLPVLGESDAGEPPVVRTVVVSDTHDRHDCLINIPPCDILFHCGDIFMTSRFFTPAECKRKLMDFNDWLGTLPAKHIVVVGGNHDIFLEHLGKEDTSKILTNGLYLCNDAVELCGLKIWASPVSLGASENKAFQSKRFYRETLASRTRAGEDVDIVVTHSSCGELVRSQPPRHAHFYGHIHARHGGRMMATTVQDVNDPHQLVRKEWVSICGAIMDHQYNPVQLPIVYDIVV